MITPLSGLDVDALLGPRDKRKKIAPKTAITDFKHILRSKENEPESDKFYSEAIKEFGTVICQLIKDSTGDLNYELAISYINAMRQEVIEEIEEAEAYNDFMLDLKKKILATSELGDDRKDFFYELKKAKLGLVSVDDEPKGGVSAEEVAAVCFLPHLGRIYH